MTGQIDPALLVFLMVGGIAVYAAYRNERLGAALIVGVAVMTLLYLAAPHPSPGPQPAPPALTTAAPWSPGS